VHEDNCGLGFILPVSAHCVASWVIALLTATGAPSGTSMRKGCTSKAVMVFVAMVVSFTRVALLLRNDRTILL
jgi:hypothetical protein